MYFYAFCVVQEIEDILEVLVLCHTVKIEHQDADGGQEVTFTEDGSSYEYTSSSPDEKAFVEACRRFVLLTLLTLNNFNGLFQSLFCIELKQSIRDERVNLFCSNIGYVYLLNK